MQIAAFPLKKRVLFHLKDNVEIPGRAAQRSGFSQTGETNACSVLDARGNLGIHGLLSQDAAFTFALDARIGNDRARALTGGAGAGYGEEALLEPHLTAPATIAAVYRRLS